MNFQTWFSAAVIFLASGPVVAADSPQKTYDIDMGCAADLQVAIAQGALPSNITATQAQPVAEVFAKRALVSGSHTGLEPARVSSDIAGVRQSILARMSSADAAKAKLERTGTADIAEKCTAVLGFEISQAALNPK